MNRVKVIGISGSSGVGKTTLSNLISLLHKNETFLILSGDDLHKWERKDPNWEKITHLNPLANDLEKGYGDLLDLKNSKSIIRKLYNHHTGKFDDAKEIKPKDIIIYEGLHALHDPRTFDLLDVKIFIDTDVNLTEKWKIKRDTKNRGYTQLQVKKIISMRKKDEEKYIFPQRDFADIIFKFYETESNRINIDCIFCKKEFLDFSEKIKEIYVAHNNFLMLSKVLSTDLSLIQESGGNISIKYDDKLMVKSSGYKMSQINLFDGFTICTRFSRSVRLSSEVEYNQIINENIFNGNLLPSMEIGFHNFLKNKIVIHTHPVYLNCILCSKESKFLIDKLFHFLNYEYVEYITPGYKLTNYFIQNKVDRDIIFLENHGLIVGCDDVDDGMGKIKMINGICENWIKRNMEIFIDIDQNFDQKNLSLFPDAVVFEDKLRNLNSYILNVINECSLTPNFLNEYQIDDINALENEKYRKKIL